MKNKRMLSAVLAALMMTAAMPFHASAAENETKHVVVIGDNIGAGTGLSGSDKSYAQQLADYLGADLTSFAQANYTTADVVQCLERADVKAALSEADVILVSAGLNDFFKPFSSLANEYLVEFGLPDFSALYTTSQAELGLTDSELTTRSNALGAAVRSTKNETVANIATIGKMLSQYQNAEVIYLNVYHPMNIIEGYEKLSAKRQLAYDVGALNPIDGTLNDRNSINPTYATLPEKYSCTVVDANTLFAGLAYKYANPMKLDPNLNAAGHDLLAVETAFVSGLFEYGNLDGVDDVSAADAAMLLEHAAAVGANKPGTLNAIQLKAADVNFDDITDASDAAAILLYAALKGANKNPDFSELASQ